MPMSLPHKNVYTFGVISDTHGYLPQRVLQVFSGVDAILHAGDIGSQKILQTLATVAPVLAVRGNMDGEHWADGLPERERLHAGETLIHLIHDRLRLKPEATWQGCLAVVSGHTHHSAVEKKNGVLYVNPGSAGAPRGGEQPSVARMRLEKTSTAVEIIPVGD